MTKITFYGGINRIGGNFIILEDNEYRILLDCGRDFSKESEFYHDFLAPRNGNGIRDYLKLGLIPRLDGIYRHDLLEMANLNLWLEIWGKKAEYLFKDDLLSYIEYKEKYGKPFIDAILITHAHLDHCGLLWAIDPEIPVYVSPITNSLFQIIENTSQNYQIINGSYRVVKRMKNNAYFPGDYYIETDKNNYSFKRKIITIENKKTFSIKSFKITPLYVDHSIPGSFAFAITDSKDKRIFYTGDFRFHGRMTHYSEELKNFLLEFKPEALIVEGTRVSEKELDNEHDVENKITEKVNEFSDKLIFITFGWKDLTRIQTILNVCKKTNRIFIIPGKIAYLMRTLKSYHPELNIENDPISEPLIKIYLPRKSGMTYSKSDYKRNKLDASLFPEWDRKNLPELEIYDHGIKAYQIREDQQKYIFFLDDYSLNELIDLNLETSSIYIRARSEAFDEEGRLDERRIKNWLKYFDINPPYYDFINIHASGHIAGSELFEFIDKINPEYIFPIHTEQASLFSEFNNAEINIKYGYSYEI